MAASAAWCRPGAARIPQSAPVSSPGAHCGGLGSCLHPHPSEFHPSPGMCTPALLPRSLGTAPLPLAAKPELFPKARPQGEPPCEAAFDTRCPCSHHAAQLAPERGDP